MTNEDLIIELNERLSGKKFDEETLQEFWKSLMDIDAHEDILSTVLGVIETALLDY